MFGNVKLHAAAFRPANVRTVQKNTSF